jgi:PAS domain S-box-containing protein
VPLIARERSLGEVILGSLKADFFNQGDVTSVETAAGQFAAAIEQSSLYSQTDQSLRQRVEQMTALAHISRELNSTLDLEHLLSRVFDEAVRTTGADCGKILLFNVGEEQPDLRGVMLSVGEEPTPDLHPLEQVVLKENESLIVNDFANLEEEPPSEWYESLSVEARASLSPLHAEVRSALIVPITYQGQVAGLIHLHARSPHHFDSALREISETLAVQAAIALGNAQRYQEQVQRSELLNRRVETLSRLFEVSQSLQSEQSLEETLETIAYAIQSATPFDLVLISVYEPQNNHLRPLANAGLPLSGMEALVANPQNWDSLKPLLCPEFRVSRSYFIPHEKMPVIPADVHALTLLPPNGTGAASDEWHPDDMLLLPLTDGSERALGLISVDGPRDHLRPDRPAVETLEIFGSQAAIAIENRQKLDALKTQVEEIRQDLASAQETATAAQQQLPVLLHKDLEQTLAIQHLSERARRISAGLGIAGLVNRQISRRNVLLILGQEILARMELETALIAEPGPEAADRAGSVRLFQTLGNLPEGANPEALLGQRNPLRQCLISGQIILVANLEEDSDWQSSPLLHALAAKSFICLPIFTEQGPDSAVLAISRSTAAPFTVEDVQLFALLTRQVAVALQNLTLIDETKRRLHEVNLLLDFSRQLGNLDTDSILHALVESAMHVAPNAQAAFVAIWDPLQELLSPKAATGYTNLTRLLEIRLRPGEALPGKVFEQRQATCLDDVDFARHYNFLPDNLLCYRDATEGHPPVSSMVVPIVGTTQITSLGVLVMDSFQTPAAFGQDEQALITSLAQQTALALENAGLYQASTQRAHQLEALTDVATTITSSLETDELVATLLDQLQSILPYETGTLWLRQEKEGGARQSMVVRAAGGFADSEQRVGLTVALEDSVLLSEMIHTGRPISVPDVRKDPRFPSLLEYEYQSWLGLPLVASGEVIGVIALEKAEANFYTPEYVQIATTFAGQAAVGLENANLYQESLHRAQELDQRSQFLAMLNRLSSELSGSLDAAHILNFTVQELFNVIRCSSTSAITFDAQRRAALVAEYPNTDDALPIRLPNAPIFDRLRQTQGIFQSEDATQEKELSLLSSFLIRYQTRSLLILPLAIGNELHGLLLAHTDQPYYFEPEEVEVGLTIGNQVAIAVQNARLFAETRSLTEDLEQRVQARTTELAREHHRTETLLRIITELSASLDLDQVLNRTLHVLNEMIDARQVTLLIARPGEKKLHRLASIGATPVTIEDESQSAITPDRGLAGWVISQRQGVLIDDVQQDPRWVQIPPQPTAYHRSALAVPLMIGAEALGCMLLFHDDPGHFSQDQLEMVQAAANQVAVAVNNAELYRLIRDQAEDLGSMLRNQQIETSRSKAILEAVADGVLVTDARRKITLFNASAEKILGLERNQVIGKSLEYFTGLFGKAAQSWRETINTWSLDPSTYQPGDTFAEQILLENGRVVAVRLAPVSLRNDFLGTVSIFQDITHQVESW